ncbi:hypothetical protein D3C78_1995510 [compost metagenome]
MVAIVDRCYRGSRVALQTLDHYLDFRRRLLRTLSQEAHLVSHHGETTPLLSGTGCLDSGI